MSKEKVLKDYEAGQECWELFRKQLFDIMCRVDNKLYFDGYVYDFTDFKLSWCNGYNTNYGVYKIAVMVLDEDRWWRYVSHGSVNSTITIPKNFKKQLKAIKKRMMDEFERLKELKMERHTFKSLLGFTKINKEKIMRELFIALLMVEDYHTLMNEPLELFDVSDWV